MNSYLMCSIPPPLPLVEHQSSCQFGFCWHTCWYFVSVIYNIGSCHSQYLLPIPSCDWDSFCDFLRDVFWNNIISFLFANCLRTVTGILLGLHPLWSSRLEMIAGTIEGLICVSHNRDTDLSEKSGKESLDESKVELKRIYRRNNLLYQQRFLSPQI